MDEQEVLEGQDGSRLDSFRSWRASLKFGGCFIKLMLIFDLFFSLYLVGINEGRLAWHINVATFTLIAIWLVYEIVRSHPAGVVSILVISMIMAGGYIAIHAADQAPATEKCQLAFQELGMHQDNIGDVLGEAWSEIGGVSGVAKATGNCESELHTQYVIARYLAFSLSLETCADGVCQQSQDLYTSLNRPVGSLDLTRFKSDLSHLSGVVRQEHVTQFVYTGDDTARLFWVVLVLAIVLWVFTEGIFYILPRPGWTFFDLLLSFVAVAIVVGAYNVMYLSAKIVPYKSPEIAQASDSLFWAGVWIFMVTYGAGTVIPMIIGLLTGIRTWLDFALGFGGAIVGGFLLPGIVLFVFGETIIQNEILGLSMRAVVGKTFLLLGMFAAHHGLEMIQTLIATATAQLE